MRLIDADALNKIIDDSVAQYGVVYPTDMLNMWGLFKHIIDNAPTVEPQKIVTIPPELIEKLALCVVDIVGSIDWEKAIEAYKTRPYGEWKSPKESLPRTTDKTKKYATVGAIDLQESDEVLCYLKPYCKMNVLDTDDRFIVARYVRDKDESGGYQTYWYASSDDGSFDIEDVIAWSYINKDELNIEEEEK